MRTIIDFGTLKIEYGGENDTVNLEDCNILLHGKRINGDLSKITIFMEAGKPMVYTTEMYPVFERIKRKIRKLFNKSI